MDWQNMLFQNLSGIVRTIIVGSLAYAALVLFLRISGKRTLAKLNAFDLVVTVALGSTLSAIILQNIALAEGVTALALLILLQFAVTFLSVRSVRFAEAIRSEPSLLVLDGELCKRAMQRERITKGELDSAIRAAGGEDVGEVRSLILESDGTLSVIFK